MPWLKPKGTLGSSDLCSEFKLFNHLRKAYKAPSSPKPDILNILKPSTDTTNDTSSFEDLNSLLN